MRATRKSTAVLLAAAMVAGVGSFAGCSNHKGNHDKWKEAAVDRYGKMRSGVMLEMAQQQFDAGDLDLAEKTVKEAVSVDPRNPALYVMAGRIALERGQLERAFLTFGRAIELDAEEKVKNAESRYFQGVVLQRWQKYEDARARYQDAYDIERDNVSYLLASAEMLVELDRVDEAITTLEAQVVYFDQNPAIRVALGHLHAMKGDVKSSVSYFEQASILDPEDAKIREELGLAQLASGRTREGIETLEGLLAKEGLAHRADLRRTLAASYQNLGRVDKARELYLGVARGEHGEARDWVRLGELALKEADLFAALEASNQAIRLAPERHEGYLLAGMVWQKRDRVDEALRMFDRAAELSPTDAAPLILRGITLERAGRRAAAAEAYAEALRRAPGDARAQKLLSNVD